MKRIELGNTPRETMKKGIDLAVDIAKVTLGGKGKNVMINTPGSIHTTKDGVTVLKHVAHEDDVVDMGVKMVLEAAEKQVSECADGTTSVSVFLQALVSGGLKNMAAGADSLQLRTGIEKASNAVIEKLTKMAIKVNRTSKEIFEIAKVSAHGDEEIGNIVAEIIGKTGEHSHITVEESPVVETYIDLTNGVKLQSGWLSNLFITNHENLTAELENPLVLIYEGKILNVKEMVVLLDKINQAGRSLLIISDHLEGEPLASLSINVKKGNLKLTAINPFGHNLEDVKFRLKDIAIATGGTLFSPDEGHKLNEIELEDLGSAKKIIVGQRSTTIVGGDFKKEEMDIRISDMSMQLEEADSNFEKVLIKGRLASLTGGIGTIYVGGTLESETKERKDRVDDALGSALSSLENGIVPGGGISLLIASKVLDKLKGDSDDENTGIKIVKEALELPFKQIVENAGENPEVILNEIMKSKQGVGYNVLTGQYVDMIEEGILDPAKVEINVVRNATSVAVQFLNTEGIISPIINAKQ